jgi:predicted amidophosphoribosyltransferase
MLFTTSMNIELHTSVLKRIVHTESQTHKSREQRVENMQGAFEVVDHDAITRRHLLLVDDVLTTGATLEACANVLLDVQGVQISLATIACGRI